MIKTTSVGEPILDGLPICVPKILMPRPGIDLSKWSCVACDQFESEPQYWQDMDSFVGNTPSSLRIVFPEVYLASVTGGDKSDDRKRIDKICATMKQYVDSKVFVERPPAFVALDRKTPCVPSRKGLVVAVDLEEYNFNCPVPTMIRPTEKTIVARLPPRVAIRENASIELTHIIMIIDDPGKTVIEPLFTDRNLTEPEYEVELFKGAGVVKGLRVTPEGTSHVERSMKALAAKEVAAAAAAGRQPAVILIGDGNHSLATAKTCWNNLKAQPGIGMDHPQRYALVELQNLHDDGVVFEPIHRIVQGTSASELRTSLESEWNVRAKPYAEPVPGNCIVLVSGPKASDRVILEPPADKLPVVSMSTAVDAFAEKNPGVNIGYVHGEEPVTAACVDGKAVGLILPALDKSRFLATLHDIGTLPRKAFSMGEANEKRFYLESRTILPPTVLERFRGFDDGGSGQIPIDEMRSILLYMVPGISRSDSDSLMVYSGAVSGNCIDYEKFLNFLGL